LHSSLSNEAMQPATSLLIRRVFWLVG